MSQGEKQKAKYRKKVPKMRGQKGVFLMRSKGEKWKEENSFFINPKTNKIECNKKCLLCREDCKQSFRVQIVSCANSKI